MSNKVIGFTISFSCLLLFAFSYTNCSPVHEIPESESLSSLGENSPQVFASTLKPILNTNCALCHDGSSSLLAFASSDTNEAHSTILNSGLINVDNTEQSRLVQKIMSGHNSISQDIAQSIHTAINSWLDQLESQ